MSDRRCSPLLAGIIGFVLGALAVKLALRFCPVCRSGCCCGESECCGGAAGGSQECCCCEEAAESPSGGEAETPAE